MRLPSYPRRTTTLSIVLIGYSFVLIPGIMRAEPLTITPSLISNTQMLEKALTAKEGYASTTLKGAGAFLEIEYFSSEDIDLFLVPLNRDGRYVPTDFMTAKLPAAANGDVRIDLRETPGWKTSETLWLLNIASSSTDTDAGFTGIEFVPASPIETLSAAMTHLSIAEPYGPSSYHVLRGYRVLGLSFAVLLGLITIIIALIVWRIRGVSTALWVLVTLTLLSHLRYGIDLLRFSHEHLTSMQTASIYDEAGTIYAVAESIKEIRMKEQRFGGVFVCRNGTDFQEKILRYQLYPTPVSHNGDGPFSFVVIIGSPDWSQDEASIRCGDGQFLRISSQYFSDGISLHTTQKS
ncbi:MAG: hypothetical protein ABL890_02255 [Candidatus Peribacteraceae bacterium]